MRRLIAKAIPLLLPLACVSLALAGLAWHSGEALPISSVADIQEQDETVIFGSSQIESIMGYKLERYRRRLPKILILGSSRMMQARDRFFTRSPEAVYNAAGPGWGLPTIVQFYERLPQPPDIVILGIDQFWFNADLPLSTAPDAAAEPDFGWESIRRATVETTHRLLGGQLTIPQILAGEDPVYSRRGLGLQALQSSFGYRADGSLQQGMLIQSRQMQAAHVAAALTNFEGNDRFAPASQINQTALDLLADLLIQLSLDGVMVVGVTPPAHFVVFEAMEASGANRYIDEATREAARLFDAHGYHYHYVADLRAYDVDSGGWYDRIHLTESTTLRMLLLLFDAHPEIFAEFTDVAVARELLTNAANPMDVLGELPH